MRSMPHLDLLVYPLANLKIQPSYSFVCSAGQAFNDNSSNVLIIDSCISKLTRLRNRLAFYTFDDLRFQKM